jgi:uncharacterized protein
MKRFSLMNLVRWKSKSVRFPLIIQGARQVGKTYLVREFAREHFTKFYEFNFESDVRLRQIFDEDFRIERILQQLSDRAGESIQEDGLVFFDEIQDCPRAITSLKYFAENRPNLAVICAGSLLGVATNSESFPVGKVEYTWLGPFSFEEFLLGVDAQRGCEVLATARDTLKISDINHTYLWDLLRRYYVTGGLPRPISVYTEHKDDEYEAWKQVRLVQQGLVRDYMSDFSKYTGQANAQHIRAIFENVPEQLSLSEDKSTAKYTFSHVISGRKGFASLRSPIDWLVRAGLVNKVNIVNRSAFPLSAYAKESVFKLYLFDIGILGALTNLSPQVLREDDYGSAKGFFAESLALQGMIEDDLTRPYCWNEGQAEVEFLISTDSGVVPIEVKSGKRTRAKSLMSYIKRYSPVVAIKLANSAPHYDSTYKIQTLPLYMAWDVKNITQKF